jgi:hypothetical protein
MVDSWLTPVSSSKSAMSQADTAAGVKHWLKFIRKAIFTTPSNYQYSVEHESHRRRQSRRKITGGDIQWIWGYFQCTVPWEFLFEAPDRAKESVEIFHFYVGTC